MERVCIARGGSDDHDHEYQPDPLGGDHTCVFCGVSASGAWELVLDGD
jgi:hypothetical protein